MADEDKKETTTQPPDATKPADATDKTKLPDHGDEDDLKGLPEEWQKRIKGLRSEIAAKRQDAKAAKEEAKIAKEESAALKKAKEDEELEKKKKNGEWEAVAQEKDKALQKANERTMRAELRLHAQKEGILDPSDVNSLALEGLTLSEDGEVHGAEKAIKKLKSDKPHWFKTAEDKKSDPPRSTSSTIPEPPPGTPGKKDLSDLTNAEFEKQTKELLSGIRAKSRR